MTESPNAVPSFAIVLNRDLLFGSRIRSALKALGLNAQFAATTDRFVEALSEHGDAAAIAIIDMNGSVAWDVLGEALADPLSLPPILAFGPHTDVDNRRAAKSAGVSRIVSNGQFQREMVGLIDRYRRR
jgi:hypothetical protein